MGYPEGATVSITCNSGYLLQGISQITCQSSGNWTDQPPTCQGIDKKLLLEFMKSFDII